MSLNNIFFFNFFSGIFRRLVLSKSEKNIYLQQNRRCIFKEFMYAINEIISNFTMIKNNFCFRCLIGHFSGFA